MPTVEEFEAAYITITSTYGSNCMDAIDKQFPSREDLNAFQAWLRTQRKAFDRFILEPKDFIAQVDSANLIQESFLDHIVFSMTRAPRPIIPIGSDRHFLYRLVAEPHGLQSQDRNSSSTTKTSDSHPLIEFVILGLNPTVQPQEPAVPTNRQIANLSETSTHSAESEDDNQAPGFIFFQLGELEYTSYNQEQGWSSTEDDWEKTGFNLVARLGEFGQINGVYAIYNMYPFDEITQDYQQVTHRFWGIPPTGDSETEEPEEQFSVARIGDTLGSLSYAKPMLWTEKIKHPVELVRVKPAGNVLGAIRQTVDERMVR